MNAQPQYCRHGHGPMTYRPPGISKSGPRQGQAYSASWRCGTENCKEVVWIRDQAPAPANGVPPVAGPSATSSTPSSIFTPPTPVTPLAQPGGFQRKLSDAAMDALDQAVKAYGGSKTPEEVVQAARVFFEFLRDPSQADIDPATGERFPF